MRMSVTAKVQPWKMKTEVLVGNYDIRELMVIQYH
ncbi:hypothetical protein Spico_1467 [Parasphaerochaeta coccoides DSM 17374]|uniref:Uncharacterized protein n=1 Tax=Parasphaerochaeta coccoides (strain ATCC BAA-1237 / DSM 17374 / SPN1) TaxID=760011 RepID=F4GI72_PARC1|nr:hypothetical protein Spico_0188 [Parasphaerochaeta coccoides DSM 17374]AEC02670.1 hypothetical protein Spico_1467 [Parasphaerochaeta coccoides DSM 17374]